MKLPTLREVGTEAKLLLIGIPVFIWTMIPIYHMFVFAISPKEDAFTGKLWPDHPTLHNFSIVFHQQHYFLRDFWIQFWNSTVIALAVGSSTLEQKKKYENVPVLRNLVPSQVLLGNSSFNTGESISAGLPNYVRNRIKAIAGILDRG